jgi:putative transposase
MTGEDFKWFGAQPLGPTLGQGAVVVMDNLKAHQVAGIEERLAAVGARIVD